MKNNVHHELIKKTKTQYLAYQFANVYHNLIFRKHTLLNKPPIIVYQMGKVGSSTLVKTLDRLNLTRPIFHVHRITPSGLEYIREKGVQMGRGYPSSHYFLGKNLHSYIKDNLCNRKWTIITLTREPIGRNISAFFQSLNYRFPRFINELDKNQEKLLTIEMRDAFLKNYPHDLSLNWFDVELKQVFGIDVYKSDFPTMYGYKVYQSSNVELLVIRLEDLQKCYRQSLSEFIGIDPKKIVLNSSNVSSQKYYKTIYEYFKSHIYLPEEYIDRQYNSRYARHFYTEKEINEFRNKWKNR